MTNKKSEKIHSVTIHPHTKIIDALKLMDQIFRRLLLVMDDDLFVNLVSIGDIQRAIIRGVNLNEPIEQILRKYTFVASPTDSFESIKEKMIKERIEFMPIVDDEKHLLDVIFWEDIFSYEKTQFAKNLSLPVVIMAGGEGIRLRPITYVLPKALIPYGNKSMLEKIIESFLPYHCTDFYITVNYKAEMIKYYIENIRKNKFNVEFIEEDKPYGTAGSLAFLKNKINKTFFVINCDILIQNDYAEILSYHYSNKNDLTIVSALKHIAIPYGIIETEKNGILKNITEKPEIIFQINSGMYILEPHVLNFIPENQVFHMTQLIEILKQNNHRIGVFPVSEKSWIDIGNWSEYLKINTIHV